MRSPSYICALPSISVLLTALALAFDTIMAQAQPENIQVVMKNAVESVSSDGWKVAVSSEDALARHRKEYPKLHDKLGRIEVMLKREMEAPEFDREVSVLGAIESCGLDRTLKLSPFVKLVLLNNDLVAGMLFKWLGST